MKFEGSIEFSVLEQTEGQVISEMPIHAGVKNPFGVVHVGAILWFADVSATVGSVALFPFERGSAILAGL